MITVIRTPFQWHGNGLHKNHVNQMSGSGSLTATYPAAQMSSLRSCGNAGIGIECLQVVGCCPSPNPDQ